MSSLLAHQQQQFADAIRAYSFEAPAGLLRATPQGQSARFQVYSNAYQIRLGEALKENYPVLASVLGDESFAQLAASFLRRYPSKNASIRWFGENLAQFVRDEPSSVPHPALHDLIRMEWALSTAFDAEDAATLQVSDFMQLTPQDWATLTLTLHPSLRLLAMEWNVEPIWTALSADANNETAAPEQLTHHLLIWRDQETNHWRSVANIEAQLLGATIAGASFTELCDVAAQAGTGANEVASYLRIWVEAGLVTGMNSDQ